MIAKPILTEVASAEKVAAVEAELADQLAGGDGDPYPLGDQVALEEQGLVVELTTGRPIVPVFALDRQGAAQ